MAVIEVRCIPKETLPPYNEAYLGNCCFCACSEIGLSALGEPVEKVAVKQPVVSQQVQTARQTDSRRPS